MSNPFAHLEKNLGRAGLLFSLAILGAVALSFVLTELGSDTSVAVLLVWAAMPLIAWFMSNAARAQGKNPWLYGLASLLPPLAIYLFFALSNHDSAIKIDAATRRHDS